MLLETVKNTLIKQNLIAEGDHIVIALSGGADSVCLLHVLLAIRHEFSLTLSAVHVNHQLRGEEAERDEAFVKALCEKHGIPCFCEHFHVKDYAITHKIGIEEAGRKLRYETLEHYRQKQNADFVATAHHSDDNAETFLMHLLRGAGVHGLTGISYRNGHIIRPLLDISKEQIIKYLLENNLSYVSDSTNNVPDVLRNKIRLELLPTLEQYNPGFRSTLARNMKIYQGADAYLQQTAAQRFSALAEVHKRYIAFSLSALCEEAEIIRCFLYSAAVSRLLPQFTAPSARIFEIDRCVLAHAGSVTITKKLTVQVLYEKLYFVREKCKTKTNDTEYTLPLNQAVRLPQSNYVFFASERQSFSETSEKNVLYLSHKKTVGQPLAIRFRRDGDCFYPAGLGHKKRLQDYFVDKKIPRFLRDEIPLLTVGGEIAWVCGYRADERFLPCSGEERVTEIKFTEENTNER